MIEAISGTTAICIVGVLALALSSLLGLVFFVNKEEKFEDVIAAQRKEQEALLSSLQNSVKSSKGNKKWNKIKSKKAAKKEQIESEEPEIDSGVDDEEPSTESVVITPKKEPVKNEETKPKKEQKEEKKSKKNGKKNKESGKKPVIVEEEIAVVEEIAVQHEEKVEAALSTPEPIVKDAPVLVVEDIVKPGITEETMAALPPQEALTLSEKSSSKKKSKKPKANKEGGSAIFSVTKLVSEVENSQLNASEVQQLIDVLLAKQNENEQWQKPKGDPIDAMKKQLSESELRLQEERQLAQSSALKIKELRNELQQERSQRQGIQQMINRYTQQIKDLENSRKKSEEQYMSEKQSSQAQITRMQQLIDNESHRGGFHQIADENQHLKRAQQQLNEEKNQLLSDLTQLKASQQSMKQEYDSVVIQFQQKDQQQKSLQEKASYFEKELQAAQQSKTDTENSLVKSLSEVQEKLTSVEGKNKCLENEISALKTQQDTVQKNSSSEDEISILSQKLLETEANLSQAQFSMKELLGQVDQKNTEIKKKEEEKLSLQKNLDELKSSTDQLKDVENKIAIELESLKSSLQEKTAQLDTVRIQNRELTDELEKSKQSAEVATPILDEGKLKELEDALAERTEQTKKLEESVESMKKKNNDLREKNWKAMDALGKAEEESKNKEKSLEKTIFKSLKNAHPDLKLPKKYEGLENFFHQLEITFKDYSTEKEKASKLELDKLRSENEDLQKRLKESNEQKKGEADQEKVERLATENSKLKSVLGETESMLSRLQSGVDAEVKKWQEKVETKDKELEELNQKLTSLEDTMKEHGFVQEETHPLRTQVDGTPSKKKHGWTNKLTKIIHPKMDTNLKETQKELENQKEEYKKLQQQMEKFDKKMQEKESEVAQLSGKLKEANDKASEPVKDNAEVEVLNNKLKKTTSERDLAIREYKRFKDTVANLEGEMKKNKEETQVINETHKKELKKLQDQVIAFENTAKISGKGDKDKDKLIAKLYIEIEELKEDLREERDRVIVDIETPESEGLQQQLESLTSELKQEKEDKFNLSVKLSDLEKSYQEDQSDKDKVLNLESKLKAAEAKIVELESTRSKQIVNEIEDAMQQNAASAPAAADFGTSV